MTSKLQPMDKDIIKNLKLFYRKSEVQKHLQKMEESTTFYTTECINFGVTREPKV